MNRTRRAAAVFLLALTVAMTVALPVAALPAPARAHPSLSGFFAALWARVAPVLGIAEKSRGGADPNGVTAPAPTNEDDSRSSADPNG